MNDTLSNPAGTVHASAARYSRIVSTLRGDVPTIRTVGILTAALIDRRLDDQEATPQNARRNAKLLGDLATYSTCQIKGRFGPLENPYVVANLPRARLVELGVKYGQDAVIFGYRKDGKMLGMGFEWICTDAAADNVGHVVATRRMMLTPRAPEEGRDSRDASIENEAVFRSGTRAAASRFPSSTRTPRSKKISGAARCSPTDQSTSPPTPDRHWTLTSPPKPS